MLNSIVRYFDLQSDHRPTAALSTSAGSTHAAVIPQYLIVCLGIIIEPFLRTYISQNTWQIDLSQLAGRTVFGLIIGIVILPSIYKSSFDASKPIAIQLAALFPLGLGWQSLFATATKAAGV